MTVTDIQHHIKILGLKSEEYIVIGSGLLAALGLRECNDVDLVVTKEKYKRYKNSGWIEKKAHNNVYLQHGVFECSIGWDRQKPGLYSNLKELKKSQIIIDGTPYISLERLRAWKQRKGREKDLVDIKLIDKYLTRQK